MSGSDWLPFLFLHFLTNYNIVNPEMALFRSTRWILLVIGFAWKVWSLVAETLGNTKVYLPDHHLQFSHWHQFFSQKKFVFLLGNTATCCDKFVLLPSFFLIILVIDILELVKGNCQQFMVQIIFAIKMIKSL